MIAVEKAAPVAASEDQTWWQRVAWVILALPVAISWVYFTTVVFEPLSWCIHRFFGKF